MIPTIRLKKVGTELCMELHAYTIRDNSVNKVVKRANKIIIHDKRDLPEITYDPKLDIDEGIFGTLLLYKNPAFVIDDGDYIMEFESPELDSCLLLNNMQVLNCSDDDEQLTTITFKADSINVALSVGWIA